MLVDGEKLKQAISNLSIHVRQLPGGTRGQLNEFYAVGDVCKVIDDIQPPARTDVRSSERIEAAIRYIETHADVTSKMTGFGLWGKFELADLLRWVLGQEQSTWEDKDFGL